MTHPRIAARLGRLQGICRPLPLGILLAACLFGSASATPDKAAKFYEDALGRYEKSDMSGAVIQLKNALQQDQKMLAAHLLLGKALLRDGNLKGAEAAFEEALKLGVNRSEVVLPLGQVYLALGRPEAVIERILPAGLPTNLQVEVLTMRGNAYLESGNNRLASQSYAEARALDPRAVSPLVAEVPLLLASGQLEQAREKAAKALELAPNNGHAWAAKASVLHASFDLAGALAAYDKALTLEPRHIDARIARAALLVDLKRDDEARKDLDFLSTAAPDEVRAAYLRALLASRRGDATAVSKALGDVTRVIDALPLAWLSHREQLLMTGALAHHGLGNQQKAIEYLGIIVARNSRNLGARKLLASIYIDTGDFDRALSLLEAARKTNPDDPQLTFLLGSVHMAQRHYRQAAELFEKAAARTGSAEINRALAFSQLGLDHHELGQANLEKAFAAKPADSKVGTTLAMIYMRQGNAKKALKTAETMVQNDPGNLTALNFLGTIKAASGDKPGARAAYDQVLAKDPAFRPAALNLVRLDVAEKRFDAARQRLDGMLRKHHDDAGALFEYGMLEQRAGRSAEAIRHLQKASEVQRGDSRASIALIELHLGQRQPDQALNTAKTLALRKPDNLPVQLILARTYLANGEREKARSTLADATRIAGYDADALVTIARMQLEAGNPSGANYDVQKALQGRPDDPVAMALQMEVEMRQGNAAKADAALKALMAKHPNRIETAIATASLAMSRAQYPAAIAAYRNALAREENTALALALVRAHLAAGEAAKAAAFLEGWMKKHPGDLLALKALAETQFRAGQLAAARQNYAKVLEIQPDDAEILNNYANLLRQMNDPGAQAAAEKALQLARENPFYADTLGWILVQKGQIDAGVRYLREARLRDPASAEIRYHLAYALTKSGRKTEAREELSAALPGLGRLPDGENINKLKQELGL